MFLAHFNHDGFSTLELLIAFSILTLSMTAIIMMTSSNQSGAIDTELARQGLTLVTQTLEEAQTRIGTNFDSVTTQFTTTAQNALFKTKLTVRDISECVKRIESDAFWSRDIRNLSTKLQTIAVDPKISDALHGDCAIQESSQSWDNLTTLTHQEISKSGATALDELDHKLYITTHPDTLPNQPEFYIFDFNEHDTTLTKLSSIDLSTNANSTSGESFGLYDVDVIPNFAFVASGFKGGQFQVLDITNPTNPILLWSISLPGVNVSTGSYPEARTIYYYDKRVYIGTHETAGPEFHIFDVHKDLTIFPPVHLGSLEITHNVHDIVVRNTYAYLATSDNNHELMIVDIADPKKLKHPDITNLGFDAIGTHDGSAVFVTGDRIYIGRRRGTKINVDDFIILSRESALNTTSVSDGRLGGITNTGLTNNTEITGIHVSGEYAFLTTNKATLGLTVYNIADLNNIVLPAPCSTLHSPLNATSIDSDSNHKYLFVSSANAEALHVIHNQHSLCEL